MIIPGDPQPRLSRAAAGRLSLYLRRLELLERNGTVQVSSLALGDALCIPDTQVRKDLAAMGNRLGHPGVGYDVPELITAIRSRMGIDREWRAALVGVGNLARALLRYDGFSSRGFRVVCLFDSDPAKVGKTVEGLSIHSLAQTKPVIRSMNAELGIIAVPGSSAQMVADVLIDAGVKGILNFAPGLIRVPLGVNVVNVDLTIQLEQLAFMVHVGD
ncbi:MAG: redox-sensing transcriptional repressor Rex [Planctomycetia bacterium]|nr:redox-sensing transcriptional repressor Rex [Planctomycetia bacterium]